MSKNTITEKENGLIENLIDQTKVRAFPYQSMYQALVKLGEKFNFFLDLKPFKPQDRIQLEDFLRRKGVVYFLYDKDELVYIGSTQRLSKRILEHVQDGKKFDSFAFFECNYPTDMVSSDEVERLLINSYKTKYNKKRI